MILNISPYDGVTSEWVNTGVAHNGKYVHPWDHSTRKHELVTHFMDPD
jgi:hypothetical protein